MNEEQTNDQVSPKILKLSEDVDAHIQTFELNRERAPHLAATALRNAAKAQSELAKILKRAKEDA